MASLSRALVVVVVVAGLLLAPAAQAGMCPSGTLFLEGPITSCDLKAGQITVGGRTLQLTTETAITRHVSQGRSEALEAERLYLGLPVRAVARPGTGGRLLARSVEAFEGGLRYLGD